MSCSHEDNLLQEANQPFGDGTLSLNVTMSDFSNSSRVVNEGVVSTFEQDDVVGVLVTTGDGEGAVTYNMPYKYDGEKWSFDISTDARMFSNPKGTKYTYIVYFPYDEKADAVTTVEELKKAFSIEKDQSSEDKYIVSDLMYGTVTTSGTSVDAELVACQFPIVIQTNYNIYRNKVCNKCNRFEVQTWRRRIHSIFDEQWRVSCGISGFGCCQGYCVDLQL